MQKSARDPGFITVPNAKHNAQDSRKQLQLILNSTHTAGAQYEGQANQPGHKQHA
jgi:hypothetical protein